MNRSRHAAGERECFHAWIAGVISCLDEGGIAILVTTRQFRGDAEFRGRNNRLQSDVSFVGMLEEIVVVKPEGIQVLRAIAEEQNTWII